MCDKRKEQMRSLTIIISIVWLFASSMVTAQEKNLLLDFNESRLQHQKGAMVVLGSWAVGNIAVGSIWQSNADGSQRYFHQMNAGWNIVNLGIAALGWWSVSRIDASSLTLSESLKDFSTFQKSLLFNAGLDLGYVAGGFYLIERSKRSGIDRPERLRGFGDSIILQGAFLFAFDIVAYLTSMKYNSMIRPSLQLAPGGGAQVGMNWNF